MSKLLSIITVNYNDKQGLEKTIKSVLGQVEAEYEFLLLDGGSTDGSLQVIEAYAPQLTYWVSEKDRGVYDAMNKGIAKATGQYLMFLNGGDCLSSPTVLQESAALLTQRPAIDILYGDVHAVGYAEGRVRWRYPCELTLGFFKNLTLNHQASFIKASLFNEIGLYSEEYKIASDYLFFLQCMLQSKVYAHMPAAIVEYDSNGMSAAENYKSYKLEMQTIWDALVPAWGQRLIDENIQLSTTVNARVVKLAIGLNDSLRALFRRN
ncbi:glycosyltransferase family 2 protein [Hymenobacter volaticus]|uniref:Glycosyltransferase n=1 Tax=Hymenobacter volaticus TaxID=2932254 RepID=A0ABY4G8S5_9BACT|nr:glycosyltransferase family 2 protein [Hymenobacter volaticus]UOQ67218.1 glycosyltransferase [Hymenobacter volaticus]